MRLADPVKYRRAESTNSARRRRGLPVPTRPCPDVCELCGRKEGNGRILDASLSLDHDHTTGEFRGWLCTPCNSALGRLGDTVEAIERVLDYLRGGRFRKS